MLLAIDTSTQYAGVALLGDSGQVAQLLQWHSRRNHTVEILSAIETLLEREHSTAKDLTGIAVALGPGSFSALRIGLSVAKGIAWARGLPLVAVTTLEAEAFAHRGSGVPVCAVIGAGRGQLAWALFEDREGQLYQRSNEKVTPPEELLSVLPTPTLLCGEALEQYGEALSNDAPNGIRFALPYMPGFRVIALAYLGNLRLQAGLIQNPVTVQPLYLRQPTISEPRRPFPATPTEATSAA